MKNLNAKIKISLVTFLLFPLPLSLAQTATDKSFDTNQEQYVTDQNPTIEIQHVAGFMGLQNSNVTRNTNASQDSDLNGVNGSHSITDQQSVFASSEKGVDLKARKALCELYGTTGLIKPLFCADAIDKK